MNIPEEKVCVATVSQKGLTTIPKEVREFLKICEGDRVIFKIERDGTVSLQKAVFLPAEK
ncbi:AbrB/MazE/SpoVT family DNA-binding domain-containing protein [Pelosinus baikalensis]|uniref:Type II toxin-antitoxin system PrlF family antitoxin n=1 Tax=Pelosinus baikalensis TaxID=2892015 RepID=A0ABS8HUH0_9FIRM|nr:type II toxin-antitoxin system PrlF family antitoxin [Pelosinus baikalensis]MCC5465767.1 type II toxin-antitoxin system PrlF family antitoxin [Pelosinus baikalensis]